MIRLTDICKSFGVEQVIKEFNLNIDENEFVALMGKSGAGKTSILNIIAGLSEVDQGTYMLDQEIVSNMSKKERCELRERKLSYIVQNYGLINELTAMQNIVIGDKLFKREPNDDITKICETLEIRQLLNKKVSQLSGGQRQRVAIARSLYNNPKVLLMDEPTGNLDHETAMKIMEYIVKIHNERKITIVLVTHDYAVANFASRIITID